MAGRRTEEENEAALTVGENCRIGETNALGLLRARAVIDLVVAIAQET